MNGHPEHDRILYEIFNNGFASIDFTVEVRDWKEIVGSYGTT